MDQQQTEQGARRVADPDRWKPGKYKAKPIDWSATKSKDGLPQVCVLFGYEQRGQEPGSTEHRELMWFGSFKGGARERTLETLLNLGLRGPVSTCETGRDGKALDAELEAEIVVEHRIFNGEKRAGISWVNLVGGRGLQHDTLAQGEAQTLFSEVDQEFMATLQAKGIAPKVNASRGAQPQTLAQQVMQQGTLNEADIPF